MPHGANPGKIEPIPTILVTEESYGIQDFICKIVLNHNKFDVRASYSQSTKIRTYTTEV